MAHHDLTLAATVATKASITKTTRKTLSAQVEALASLGPHILRWLGEAAGVAVRRLVERVRAPDHGYDVHQPHGPVADALAGPALIAAGGITAIALFRYIRS